MADDLNKNYNPGQTSPAKNQSQAEQEIQTIFRSEYEKAIKEAKDQKREYERKLQEKTD